ncbi:glycerate kinase [Clostridium estertheticum]|nr:glycerate kinase [Clostridium estertheticum]WAG56833.1 glycerate kinase [Clostridium estertheticum]
MKQDLVIVLASDSFKESMTAKRSLHGNGKVYSLKVVRLLWKKVSNQ